MGRTSRRSDSTKSEKSERSERSDKSDYVKEKRGSRRHHHRSHRSSKAKQMFKDMSWSLLINIFVIIRLLVDKIVEFVLEMYWGDQKKKCPPLKKNFFITKSAVEIAEMIKNKELTSYEVVNGFINRIIETNPIINAVIDGPFMDALDESQKIDERISKGLISEHEWSEKPFLGVPFTTKDSTAVGGKLQTLGILARRNFKATTDAECVKLMKDAGAVIIATSSIPEINRWQETRNNIIGQTNNPYDSRRTVGGSSGGEGALITCCATAFGLGTDIGGSIRMPAYYCGIFGHKPSANLVNTRGCTLRTGAERSSMVVAGPMCKFATDLKPIFEVLVGPKNAQLLKLNEKVKVQELRYFYCLDNGDLKCSKLTSEVKRKMNQVVSHFHNLSGKEVELVTLKGAESSSKLWRYWMSEEPSSFSYLLGNSKEVNPLIELGKKIMGSSDYTLASIYSLIDGILPEEKADKMRKITKELDEEINELLGEDGVLFYPSTTQTAPFHYAAFIQVYNFHYWSIFNSLHMPATQVPLGLSTTGLPLGIQVVATKNRDRHCLAVAEELEREFKGWVPPFEIMDEATKEQLTN